MDLDQFNIPRYLGSLPLFKHMQDSERERLAAGCRLGRFERGQLVFRAGEPCEGFHVVVLGQVKLFALSPQGSEKIIELCGPGYSFAEAVMFLNAPYIVSAQTLSESLLLTVGKQAVLSEVERNPDFALRMLAGLAQRLHGLVKDVQAYTLHSGVQRVISYLLSESQPSSEGLGKPAVVSLAVSKASVASRLSVTPEYFSRVLHELESAGLISVQRRDIHLLDPVRLANYSH